MSLGVIGAALVWAADTRYAQTIHVQQIVDKSASVYRREAVDDRLFELEQIKESDRTDAQKAMIDRYRRKLDELNAKLR